MPSSTPARGGRRAAPFCDGVIPTTMDPTLNPDGTHIFSMFTQWVPEEWHAEPHAAELAAYADRMIGLYDEVAPGFSDSVIARDIVGPHEMETEYGLIGGNIFHGELSLEQLFHLRPGARVRRLPDPGPRPLLRQLGDPRRRRSLRHPGHAGGARGAQGRPGRAPVAAPAAGRPAVADSGPMALRRSGPAAADARGAHRGGGGRQRPARLVRRADDHRGAAQPRCREGVPWCNPRRRSVRATAACRRSPTSRTRSTWCCSASRTPPWPTSCGWRPTRGDGGAVVFGSAHGLGEELVAAAGGMEVCGAGCMGFVNVTRGVRAIGYLERGPLPAGPIALVTHSGSVFSALLRTHRRLEYSLVVSSGQELVTHHRRLPRLCAGAAGDPRRRAGAGDPAGRAAPACRPRRGGRPRHPGRGAHGGQLETRSRPGGRPLRGAGRVRRRVGGAVRGVRRPSLRRPRRARRQPRGLRDRPAGEEPRHRPAHERDRHRARLRGRAGPRGRRGRPARRPLRRPVGGHDGPARGTAGARARADEPARRVGHRAPAPRTCSPTA